MVAIVLLLILDSRLCPRFLHGRDFFVFMPPCRPSFVEGDRLLSSVPLLFRDDLSSQVLVPLPRGTSQDPFRVPTKKIVRDDDVFNNFKLPSSQVELERRQLLNASRTILNHLLSHND
jgi:hypothetical protein